MSTATEPAVPATPGRAPAPRAGVVRRFIEGDLASLRVFVVLGLIWAVFQFENNHFLTAENLTNLFLQITAVGLISVGVVYVLLLGEIDLSVGAISGLAAAATAVLNVKHGWSPYSAIFAGILVGLVIGVVQGFLFTRFGIPSFVVTLAGLLTWQGALLKVLGSTGTVNLTDPKVTGLANTFYSSTVSWIIGLGVIAIYAGGTLWAWRRRVSTGLADQDLRGPLTRVVLVSVATIGAILVVTADRGLPLAVLILLAFVAGMEYVATRTRFGRHVFAVGGNAEAARRAGIHINGVRVAVFGIAGSMAAIGGILASSRLLAVNQNSGGSDLLLLAIAGPVIAGTSLFGGRGSVWTALLGALVIGSISNGMDLLALDSSVKYMVTGGVLLVAVIVDALARRQRQAAGRL
ncbi:MAG: D-xylose transport system permease protein [Solirubrobacteraceae bacterium]|jgi:D-xylose transport system permease protein|nr:D-xylose transport system permease protein [Solirubrobacteraceae bacterium]